MDLYGLMSARAEGNARTASNDLFNEQIMSARDRINNTLDQEKIVAMGNLRGQLGTDSTDKLMYDIHDAMSGLNLASSYNRFGESYDAYQKAKAAGGGVGGFGTFISSQLAVRRGDVDKVFGSATSMGTDAASSIVAQRVSDVRKSAMPKSLGGGTGIQTAGPLTEAQQSSFLDESAAAGGVDARPTPSVTPGVNNRPKTNEPVSANANTPDIPDKPPISATDQLSGQVLAAKDQLTGKVLSATDELSGKVLSTTQKIKEGVGVAQTGMRALGDIGGAVGTYEMFKNGFAKNKDGSVDKWNEVGQIAGAVGTGLDIIGAFIPALEPLGQLAQAVSAVATTVDTHNKDQQATVDAQNDVTNTDKTRLAQLNALPQMKNPSAPVNTMVSGGLVGSQSQHINTATQGTGSF